ncbi:MAG TPA: hypothetical protein VL737_03575 [Candidatus Pristimantibacillus sp.]|jgi:hypothetical protein|nr:hypothetical protein [Candidatus Pristimantibacillus sp.]
MAQVNIVHTTEINDASRRQFSLLARDVAAREVHGLEPEQIEPDSVTVFVVPVDVAASMSGADTEVQVFVSGNDWPLDQEGKPLDTAAAKHHFDGLAGRIHRTLSAKTARKLFVWVTPFTASGWAE